MDQQNDQFDIDDKSTINNDGSANSFVTAISDDVQKNIENFDQQQF
jgi:hypothetical protein